MTSAFLKRFSRRLFGFGLLAALITTSAAQADPFVMQNDLQVWQIGSIRTHITKRILGYIDVQNNEINLTNKTGLSNNNAHYGQLLVRPALGFQVNKYLSVWQGYGWTPSFQPQFRNENQIWEQVILERKFEHLHNLSLSSRSRLEIRRIADAGGTALRFRNQFRVAFPLGHTRWSLVAYDEPFINLNTVGNGPRSGFNQNWLFFGINRKFTNSISAEVGYLNNYVNNPLNATDRMNHVVMVSMNISPGVPGIDLRRHHKPDEPNKPNLEKLFDKNAPIGTPKGSNEEATPAKLTLDDTDSQETPVIGSSLDAPLAQRQPDIEILPIAEEGKPAPIVTASDHSADTNQ